MKRARAVVFGWALLALVSGACGGSGSATDGGALDARRADGGDAAATPDAKPGDSADLVGNVIDAPPNGDAATDERVAADAPLDRATVADTGGAPLDGPTANDGPASSVDARGDATGGDATSTDSAAGEAGPTPYDGTGALSWVQRSKGNGSDQAFGMTVTTSGALVVGGHFNGTDVFAPDSATPRSFDSKGQDLWLGRWTADGALAWTRTAGTTVQSTISAVGPAPGDDVYVGGTTYASPTDPLVLGAGEPNQTTFTRVGTFFARYHADGSLVWAKVEQNGGEPWRMLPAADGGFFAMGSVGSFYATFAGVMLIPRTVPVSEPTFLARFDANGNLAWVRTMGGVHPDAALMADGGVVVVGLFGGASGVFQGGGVPDVTLIPEWSDLFVASYSAAGDLRWIKQVKGLPQVDPLATTVLSSGDIVVSATCEPYNDGTPQQGDAAHTQAVFGPGEPNETKLTCVDFDLVLARYTPAGALVWAKSIPPASPGLRGLAPLPDGGFVMASTIAKGNTIVFDPGTPGSISVSKLAQYGNLVMSWHRPDGTTRAARVIATGGPRVLGVSVLGDASIILAGAFSSTTVFGPQDAAKVAYTKTGAGYENLLGEDMFLARLKP